MDERQWMLKVRELLLIGKLRSKATERLGLR